MSSSKVARRGSRFSADERAAYRQQKRSEQREQVERAYRELLTSEGWRRWAETRATFHRYSPNNCMLIALQAPEASQVGVSRRGSGSAGRFGGVSGLSRSSRRWA
jgi:hypothetical protein